jgi:predicted nuclease with TOPRIM domain
METKAKILIVGLVLLLAVSLFSLFYVVSLKQAMEQTYKSEKANLIADNEGLQRKAKAAMADKAAAESKMDAIKSDLDRITLDKSDLQKKYDALSNEKEDLVAELKKKSKEASQQVQAQPVEPAPGAVDDSYWSAVLKDKAGLQIQVDNLKEQLSALKLNIEEIKKDKSNMEFEMGNLNRDKQDLDRKLIYNEKINDNLSAELVREKKDKIELSNQLKALNAEYTSIVRQLKNLNNLKVELDNKLQQSEKDKMALQGRINELSNQIQSAEVSKQQAVQEAQAQASMAAVAAGSTKQSVELPPIIVRSAEAPASKPAQYSGKVLAINRENNFVVIDLGEEKGMRPGVTLGIYNRGGNKIGSIEVVQIRRLISACDIKEETSPISVGDEVR